MKPGDKVTCSPDAFKASSARRMIRGVVGMIVDAHDDGFPVRFGYGTFWFSAEDAAKYLTVVEVAHYAAPGEDVIVGNKAWIESLLSDAGYPRPGKRGEATA